MLRENKLFCYELFFIWFKRYELELRDYGTCVLYMVRTEWLRLCIYVVLFLRDVQWNWQDFGNFVYESVT